MPVSFENSLAICECSLIALSASILIVQLGILGGLLGRGFLLLVLGPDGSQALDSTFGRVPKHSLLILERIVIGAPMTHFIGVIFGVLLCITVGVVIWALELLIQTLLSNAFDLRRVQLRLAGASPVFAVGVFLSDIRLLVLQFHLGTCYDLIVARARL